MFKKIAFGVVMIGLAGVLVIGALNRTAAKAGAHESRGPGQGWNQVEQPFGRRGGGRGQGAGNRTGAGQAVVGEWVTLEGTVVSADADALVVKLTDGKMATVENRPWWFAQEQHFAVQPGDKVEMVGFYEDGKFEVGRIANTSSGQAVALREESGRPLWAGRGRNR